MTRPRNLIFAIFVAAALSGIACGAGSDKTPNDSSFTPAEGASAAPAGLAGTLLVGKDIAPGTYQGTATGMCYVARMAKDDDIIANDLYSEGDKVTLTVKATDYAVKVDRSCGLAKP